MNVLRHQNIAGDDQAVAKTHSLQHTFEDAVGLWTFKERLPAVTTEGKKMKTAAMLITVEASGHTGGIVLPDLAVGRCAHPPFAAKTRRMGHPDSCG